MEDIGTVLIVDDNPNNLEVLMGLLEHAGYKVRPALSGEIALRAVVAGLPDLILLDVRMPGLDGYETCRRLKADKRSQDIPVIFISALQDTEDKLAGFGAGGVDYVAKPFQAEEVLARVRAHIQLHRIKQQLESMVEERTRKLAQSEARYRVLFEDSPLAVVVYDIDDWRILETNLACARAFGYAVPELIGKPIDFSLDREQRESLRLLSRNLTSHSEEAAYTDRLHFHRRDGQLLEAEGIVQRIDYPGSRAQIMMLQDITQRREAEDRLQQAAKEHQRQLEKSVHYDALTGLPNRALLTERMRQGQDQARRTGCWMVVCYLDLDAFGPINEAYGTETGDHLLINVAECLRSCLRGGDTLARIGGDEFALLLLGLRSEDELMGVMDNLCARLAEPFVSDTVAVTLSASVGITVYPQDETDPDTLLRHADQAMVMAKQGGKGRCQRFDAERDKLKRAQHETLQIMRAALARREFVLYYQPKVDLMRREVVGAEALIRWRHPERGLLAPGAFLPAIEGDDLMSAIGDWVIGEALGQMARWRAEGVDLTVSVNIAAQHLVRPDFVDRMRAWLEIHVGTPNGRLELEVLETSALDDVVKVEEIIVNCRDLGVGFSLDDFGTGYSSLTYLRRLSADTLKIDQSFVRGMMENTEDHAIVAGVIGLAEAFQRKVIAEGVETVEHGKSLLGLGCFLLQGYGIARPMPAEDLPGWVKGWPDAAWLRVVSELMDSGSLAADKI